MSEWAVLCSEADLDRMGGIVANMDESPLVYWTDNQDELRERVISSRPGELGVVIGAAGEGVSDINLAAAVVADGRARFVAIAKRAVTGSFRSRAARAGVDLVVDFEEVEGEPGRAPAPGGRPMEAEVPAHEPLPAAYGASCAAGLHGLPELVLDLEEPSEEVSSARAPVLVFCSGRGGVGKTVLATCAAVIASRWGVRTCLLDLDLSCGNAYAMLGLREGADLSSYGESGAAPVAQICQTSASGVSVLGPCALPEAAELVFPHVSSVIERASREFELVVVDTSPTFTDAVAQAAQRADRLVIITDSREGSISSAARTSGLAVRLGVARTRIARIENRASPRLKPDLSVGRAEVGLETARVYRVFEGGRGVGELLGEGRAEELCEPGVAFADSLSSAVAKLLAELGRLPDCDEARSAYEQTDGGRRVSLFGLRREAR